MRAAGIEPLDPFPGSRKPWRGRCVAKGHVTSPTLYGINEGRHPCLYCAGKKIYPDDARTLMEERGLRPLTPFTGSHDDWACLCLECEREVVSTYRTVSKRKSDRRGCDSCCRPGSVLAEPAGARARMKAGGFEPLVDWPGRERPWRSMCLNCREECEPVYKSVTNSKGLGCRDCSAQLQDRTRCDADEAAETMRSVGLEPQEPYQTSNHRWKCRCMTCGDIVFRSYKPVREGIVGGCRHPRVRREEAYAQLEELNLEPVGPYPGLNARWACRCTECGREHMPHTAALSPCGYCNGRKVDPAEAAERLHERGLRPLGPYPGRVQDEWPAECQGCGTIRTRSYLGYLRGNCPVCTDRYPTADGAAEVMRKYGWEPLVPFEKSMTPWLSRCVECKNVSEPAYFHVKNGHRKCQWCTGRLMTEEDRVACMEIAGFTPQEPYPGTVRARWKMRCTRCQSNVNPTYAGVMRSGAASCCGSPWDLSQPERLMTVYLVTHQWLGAAKIGVGLEVKGISKRLREHARLGWEVHATWNNLESLSHALDVERVVLRRWRNDGLPPHVARSDMPQDGHTETVAIAAIDLDEVTAMVESAVDALSGGRWQQALTA